MKPGTKAGMEIPNAFTGCKKQPAGKEVAAKLGQAHPAWKELIDWLAGQGIACKEWNSYSPKAGWSLLAILKARRIAYLSPCKGCFRVALVLGDKAVAATKASDLPNDLIQEISEARRYAEGTGVRLLITKSEDLAPVRTLVAIKLKN